MIKTRIIHVCLIFVYRRGKELEFQSGFHIVNVRFQCDTAVLLLQHGVDPNLYSLRNVLHQFHVHKTKSNCIHLKQLLEVFFAAGYNFSTEDLNDNLKQKMNELRVHNEEPARLKQICRTAIRARLRTVAEDQTIFPAIDALEIPQILINFLKLQDVVNLDKSSFICRTE